MPFPDIGSLGALNSTQSGGPTGGTAGTPQGGSQGIGAGDVATQALQYLMRMFGMSEAQAAQVMQSHPEVVQAVAQGGGQGNGAQPMLASMVNVTPGAAPPASSAPPAAPPAAVPRPMQGPELAAANAGPPRPPVAPPAGFTPPARPAGVSATGLPLSPGSLGPNSMQFFGPNAAVPTPSGGGSAVPGVAGSATPTPNPAAVGGQNPNGVTPNRFGLVQYNVPGTPGAINPGMARTGGPISPIYTAGGNFGQPAAVAPARVAGPLAAGGPQGTGNIISTQGPNAGRSIPAPLPPYMSPADLARLRGATA